MNKSTNNTNIDPEKIIKVEPRMVKVSPGGSVYTWLLIFAIWLCLLVGFFSKTHAQTHAEVFAYCSEIGIKHPEIVTKQSVLETGWFTCEDCSRDVNNLFGFRYKKKYIIFDTWKQSCDYYLTFQNKYYKGGNYFDFLNCIWKHRDGTCARYATSLQYTDKLKAIEL